ncbi:MAG: hypothetical protein KatS3mg061_1592 [Dehalococcoidia bacterium]|nr:MAG: hypothetical protein KatS3mg061_1592 [Dehalococcoidia bacterium]
MGATWWSRPGGGSDPTNLLEVIDLATGKVTPLQTTFDATTRVIGNAGTTFWLATTWEAPRGRVVAVRLEAPDRSHWQPVIAEQEAPLLEVALVGEQFFVVLLRHLETEVLRFRREGTPNGRLDLPSGGVASGFSGRRTDRELFFAFQSLVHPETVYRLDLATETLEPLAQLGLPFCPDAFALRREAVPTDDGVQVPLLLAYRRDRPPGPAPTLLFCYGGFGLPAVPRFLPSLIAWLELGGVYAVAGVRGGGEQGTAWHAAARGARQAAEHR